ncbi:MAG: TldD/PmbA family protein [Bacillota bacterium]
MDHYPSILEQAEGLRPDSVASVFTEARSGIRLVCVPGGEPAAGRIELAGSSVSLTTAGSALARPDGSYSETPCLAWVDQAGDLGFYGTIEDETMRQGLSDLAREAWGGTDLGDFDAASARWPPPCELIELTGDVRDALMADMPGLTCMMMFESWAQQVACASSGYAAARDTRSSSFGLVAVLMECDGAASLGAVPCRPADSSADAIRVSLLRAGEEALATAAESLGTPYPEPGRYDTVWDGIAATAVVHEGLGHTLEARHGASSVMSSRMGQQVTSDKITVVEDPTTPGVVGGYRFDDEGVPSRRSVLIEEGVLRQMMHDRGTALALGVPPNGHGRRGSFRVPGMARMANTSLLGNDVDPESLIGSIERGLFITRAMGGRSGVSGVFKVIIGQARVIERGRLGGTLSGFLVRAGIDEGLMRWRVAGPATEPLTGDCGLRPEQTITVSTSSPVLLIPDVEVVRPLTGQDILAMFRDPGYSIKLLDSI